MTRGLGLIVAGTFFVVAIAWIGCDHYQERQCREKELRWQGTVGVGGECIEP
jgi:hypothetical protein